MATFTEKNKTITAFGGSDGMTIAGLCGYLEKVLELNNYKSPMFTIDISDIDEASATADRQCESNVIMTADELISGIISEDSGLDYYFLPCKDGYIIKVFAKQYPSSSTTVDVESTYCKGFTLSTLTKDNYTAIRVIGERIKIYWGNIYPNSPTDDAHPVIDYDGRNFLQKLDNQDAYNSFSFMEKRSDWENGINLPKVTINPKNGNATFTETTVEKQTKYLNTLQSLKGREIQCSTYALLDARAYKWNNDGVGANNVPDILDYESAKALEAGTKPLEGDIGTIVNVNHWLRLCDGDRVTFNANGTISVAGNQTFLFNGVHKNPENIPQMVKDICVPDLCFDTVCNCVCFELDQRVQCIFGNYKSEDRTLTVYQEGAELYVESHAYTEGVLVKRTSSIVRNDFAKLKAKYEETVKAISVRPCEFTAQFAGIYSPAILGTGIVVNRNGKTYNSKNSLSHITYIFQEGKTPETRL